MSDFRAIGGVSTTLQTLLHDRMELPSGMDPPVTIGPPPYSSKDVDPRLEPPRLNLFLYRVTENGFLQNQEIPGRSASSGYGHPPLSLNLHYLVSAYGNKEVHTNGITVFDESDAHVLLGSAMRVLHDVPIITTSITTLRPPSGLVVLDVSLRDAYEQIRLSLEPLTLEDITKVWTALALRYRLSAAYLVNVVQIESRRPRVFPRPVGKPLNPMVPPLPTDPPSPGPWIHALTIQAPTITELRIRRFGQSQEQPFPYAAINDTVVLIGTGLSGPETTVVIGDLEVPATLATPTRVEATIPDDSILGSGPIPPERQLQPGVRSVHVLARDPRVPHATFTSNEAALMLVPYVDPAKLGYAGGPPRALTIQGLRLMPPTPGGETVIGRAAVPASAYLPGSTPLQLHVPIPPQLPARGVRVFLGGPLPDPVPVGGGPHTLRVTIGATPQDRTRVLPASIPLGDVAAIVEAMIHDAAPAGPTPDTRFTEARVGLAGNRLFVIAGDLTSAISVTSPASSTLAASLKLNVPQPPGANTAFISGVLGSPPPLTSSSPRVHLTVAAAATDLDVPTVLSLEQLAADLQARLNAVAQPAFATAIVATTRSQLLLIAGIAGKVSFDGIANVDERTAAELQLHARFAVRVRVNGAESIDAADVDLPQ